MAKMEYRKLGIGNRKIVERELLDMLLPSKKKDDAIKAFLSMLTPSEKLMIARRIQVAKHLIAGKSYLQIRKRLKVGFDLITTVDRWLDSELEAYRSVIPPLLEGEKVKSKKRAEEKRPLGRCDTFTGLRRRYPDKFALVNMLLDD